MQAFFCLGKISKPRLAEVRDLLASMLVHLTKRKIHIRKHSWFNINRLWPSNIRLFIQDYIDFKKRDAYIDEVSLGCELCTW